MSTITANIQAIMNISELISVEDMNRFSLNSSRIYYNLQNQSISLADTTTPNVTDVLFKTLNGPEIGQGSAQDITTYSEVTSTPADITNKRIVTMFFKNSSSLVTDFLSNPAYITTNVANGIANHPISGYGTSFGLYPGQWALFYFGAYGPYLPAGDSFAVYGYEANAPGLSIDFLATFGTSNATL